MTNINEPDPNLPPAVPSAAPPPPVGPPIGQPGYPQAYQPGPPVAPRSTGKLVAGIILTVLGGLWALAGLSNIGIALSSFADNPGYATGRLIGGLLLPAILLIVGIILIRASKPKAQ
jgi:hypothetical protein